MKLICRAVLVCSTVILFAGCDAQNDVPSSAQQTPSGSDAGQQVPAASGNQCSPDVWKKMPEGAERDALVERCMTGGSYQHTKPKTF